MTRLSDFITPSKAAQNEDSFTDVELDMDALKQPMPDELFIKFKDDLKRNPKLHDIYYGLIKKPSRSEVDFTVAKELKWLDYDLQETAFILVSCPYGKGEELLHKKRELIRAYNRTENIFNDIAPLSDDHVKKIANQRNPILDARKAGKPLDIDLKETKSKRKLSYQHISEMDWRYSGAPIYKDFLYEKSITVMYGGSNVGKSFVATDIAGHIALARNWGEKLFKPKMKNDKKKRRQIGVLYICAEAAASYGKRGKAMRKRLSVEKASKSEFPYFTCKDPVNFVGGDEDAKLVVDLIEEIEEDHNIKIGMVVVDTLATTFQGGNENSSEDMGTYISNMKWIQRYADTGVMIVHHSGKDQAAGARGHSSLRAATDTELEVTSEKRGNSYLRKIKTRKQREGESDEETIFGLHVVELGKDEDDDPIDTCFVVLENDEEFNNVVPSLFDHLSKDENDLLKVLYLFEKYAIGHLKVGVKTFSEKEIKAILFRDVKNNVGDFVLCNGTIDLSGIGAMEQPKRGVLKNMERVWNKLEDNAQELIIDKYQIDSKKVEHMEQSWNIDAVP